MRKKLFFLFSFLIVPPLHAATLTEQVGQGTEKLKSKLPLIRIAPEDLSIPARWPVLHAIPAVEDTLENPMEGPAKISGWVGRIQESKNSSGLIRTAADLLVGKSYPPLETKTKTPVENILETIRIALPLLIASYESITPGERNAILRVHDYPAPQEPGESPRQPAFKRRAFRYLERFDQAALMRSASVIMEAVDKQIPNMQYLQPVRYTSEFGEVIVAGRGDDVYDAETLEKTCLLIDLGGNNKYLGRPAGAREGEIRIVIDFGENVVVTSTQNLASAGAGVFGIGLFYLPSSFGTKTFETRSYSQGFGLCGVGGLFVNGRGVFKADRYVQGAGGFGAGIFSNTLGKGSEYSANLYGQGVGFTQGVGIFRHTGSSATLKGGLMDPDPREALGSTSLCQGVGFGPRAYAAGGAGFCVLKGDGLSLESSYFAQGAGYWHALGAFVLEGNQSTIKARRYDQGSGVHSAVGFFALSGNENRMVNWGVGPGFGWDRSIGWSFLFGDKNSSHADWGSGNAALNASRSFIFFKGNENTFELPGLGGGSYAKDVADYGLAWIEGSQTRLKSAYFKSEADVTQDLHVSPWGLISFHGITLSSETALAKESWERLPQAEFVERENMNLGQEIEDAKKFQADKKVSKLLTVASAFSVEKNQPRQALMNLISLSGEEIVSLCKALDPADFDGFIQIRAALSEMGPAAGPALLSEYKTSHGERRAWILAQMPFLDAETAMPELIEASDDPDWKVRAMALRGMGIMLSRDQGYESGRMRTLENLHTYFSSAVPTEELEKETVRKLANRSYFESAALLSLAWEKSVPDRLKTFESAPAELSGSYEMDQAKAVLQFLRGKKDIAENKYAYELKKSARFADKAHSILIKSLDATKKSNKLLIPVIINALGNMGNPDDAPLIAPYLSDPSAAVREASSAALARIGITSLPLLIKTFKSGNAADKVQTLCSVGRAWDAKLLEILDLGLESSDTTVRSAAIGMVSTLRFPFDKDRENLVTRLKKESLPQESSQSRLQIRYLYGE